jgi:isopentenyl diphosphate isomerase/L-lactate dehydrogenase-like FMN-dependent dehydrogenase
MLTGDMGELQDAARRKLPSKAWNYYSAGGTDETTVDLNRTCWNKILFRPRVMNDVSEVDLTTEFLGHPVEMPVFVSSLVVSPSLVA